MDLFLQGFTGRDIGNSQRGGERIFAYSGYAGPKMNKLFARTGDWTIEIVKRSDIGRFVLLP